MVNMENKDRYQLEYKLGWEAYQQGKDFTESPYVEHTYEDEYWLAGWCDCMEQTLRELSKPILSVVK